MTMTTQEVIEKYYEYVNADDWESWFTLFADDVVMDEQLAGQIKGVQTLKDGMAGFKKGYSKFNNYPKHIFANGKEGCAVTRIVAANAAGVPIESNVANYFVVENGKITYMANFHDSRPFDPFMNQKLD
jgi:ketosteroid isomerase-like protein